MRKVNFSDAVGFHKTIINNRRSLHIGDWAECPDGDIQASPVGNDVIVTCAGKGVGVFKNVWRVGEEIALAQSYRDAGYDENHRLFGSSSSGWTNARKVIAEAMPIRLVITDISIARLHDLTIDDLSDLGMNVNKSGAIEVRGNRGDLFLPQSLGGSCDPKEGALRLMFDVGVAKMRGCYDENPAVLLYRFEVERRELC